MTSQPAHVLGAAGWVVGKTFGVARGVYSVRLLWMCARVEFLFVFAFFDAVGCCAFGYVNRASKGSGITLSRPQKVNSARSTTV